MAVIPCARVYVSHFVVYNVHHAYFNELSSTINNCNWLVTRIHIKSEVSYLHEVNNDIDAFDDDNKDK